MSEYNKLELTDAELEELARQKKNEYQRNWYKQHPTKAKEYQAKSWKKKAIAELNAELEEMGILNKQANGHQRPC